MFFFSLKINLHSPTFYHVISSLFSQRNFRTKYLYDNPPPTLYERNPSWKFAPQLKKKPLLFQIKFANDATVTPLAAAGNLLREKAQSAQGLPRQSRARPTSFDSTEPGRTTGGMPRKFGGRVDPQGKLRFQLWLKSSIWILSSPRAQAGSYAPSCSNGMVKGKESDDCSIRAESGVLNISSTIPCVLDCSQFICSFFGLPEIRDKRVNCRWLKKMEI